MSASSWVLIGTFAAVYGALALLAGRRPLLARLAFREARRGGLQTGLVVAGLALAGMGITAALVGADSTDALSLAALVLIRILPARTMRESPR